MCVDLICTVENKREYGFLFHPKMTNTKLNYILEIKNIKTIISTTTFYFLPKYVF